VSLRDAFAVRRLSDDVFESRPAGGGFLFGGLTLAVALTVAAETVREDLVPKSLHAYFLRPGRWGHPTLLSAARTNDGRTFAARTVTAAQGERPLVSATVSFHLPGDGPDWQAARPHSVPPPEDCADVAVHLPAGLILLRSVNPVHRAQAGDFSSALHPYWARPVDSVGDHAFTHCAAIAFMSDYAVTTSMLAAVPTITEPAQIRTVDHSLWFHRAVDTNDWLLFSADPVSLSDGRGLAHGSVRTRDGSLVASFSQEVVIPA
jgi:acyl-CoA thioesterase-2